METRTMKNLDEVVRSMIHEESNNLTNLIDAAGIPALVAVGLEAMAEVSAVKVIKDGDILVIEFNDGDHVHTHRHTVVGEARNGAVNVIVDMWK